MNRLSIGCVLGVASVSAGMGLAKLERGVAASERPAVVVAAEPEIDTLLTELYACISGPKGEPRDWETFDRIFTDDATLAAYFTGADGNTGSIVMTPAEYKERSGPLLVNGGFTETEIARELDVYGHIAHAFSTYRGSYTDAMGEAQLVEGINSVQMVKSGEGWRVRSLVWQQADEQTPIPEAYLPAAE